jgi:hypothetical protein
MPRMKQLEELAASGLVPALLAAGARRRMPQCQTRHAASCQKQLEELAASGLVPAGSSSPLAEVRTAGW